MNVAKQIGKFTIYNEIWTSQNFDPAGTVQQYSYDMALVWLPRPTLQFDIGVNIGLNRNTPAIVAASASPHASDEVGTLAHLRPAITSVALFTAVLGVG